MNVYLFQQMAEIIGNDMISLGIKVKRPAIPTKVREAINLHRGFNNI